jgi:K+-transporting ATPase ATPase A chain
LVLMANMMVDEVIVGAPGSGPFGILLFAIVAVFVAGLMVGRTPEYLGKKINATEVKMTMLALLAVPAAILALTAVACVVPAGLAGLGNNGPHGFSELLYAYTSAAATNGSAFAGLSANTPFFNLSLALAMFVGRFMVIIPVLTVAGSLAAKRVVAISAGTLPTDSLQFAGMLIGTVLIVGGLTFFPALALARGAVRVPRRLTLLDRITKRVRDARDVLFVRTGVGSRAGISAGATRMQRHPHPMSTIRTAKNARTSASSKSVCECA